MSQPGYVLLTGATGFLGRYLLRGLLASGRRVAVLVRDGRATPAAERVAELVESWRESAAVPPQGPVVLVGDVHAPGLRLQAADRTWLSRHCRSVVHAAACISLRSSPTGEPWRTNVDGTQHLLDLCTKLGLSEFHYVSTAYVCGDRAGTIHEDALEVGARFHNEYERSKCEAERRVQGMAGMRSTIYRPSLIVGDSRSGYTSSYQGFYRFVDLANRLAQPAKPGTSRRLLPLRLPFTGNEGRNLVPVDWVAQAIIRILGRPHLHGRTYHLVARRPVSIGAIKHVAETILKIDGVECSGPGQPADATILERQFFEGIAEYWPYLHGDPTFDCRNTLAALPDQPAPTVDRVMLARLIRFAVADRWGHSRRHRATGRRRMDFGHYLEQFLPVAARHSALSGIPLTVTVGLAIRGPGGGQWQCRWVGGELVEVHRGHGPNPDVVYALDGEVFADVVRGLESPQEAFFERRIEVAGNVEKGLKLAVLFERFVREFPYHPSQHRKTTHVLAMRV